MFKAKRTFWLAQIIGWALFSTMIYLATFITNPKINTTGLLVSTICFFFFGIIISYLMRFIYIKLGWLDIKFSNITLRILGVSVLASILMSLMNNLTARITEVNYQPFTFIEFLLDVTATLIIFALWNGIYFSIHYYEQSNKQQLNNIILTASNNEIELKNLRSQLNPHFLFNSLNSIRALIDIDPSLAKNNVTKLSNLLRNSLIMGGNQLVSLEEELAIVKDYLDLEKVRFEERLSINFELDTKLNQIPFPPFILQTLVENAIKHGLGNLIHGGDLWIRTKNTEAKYIIEVENTGVIINPSKKSTGVGIQNTKRRLAIQYKGKATFNLIQTEKGTVISQIEIQKDHD